MFLVIRIRGTTGVKQPIASTLEMLRLNRISHAVLVEENPSYKGMLQKAKDYITWGEVDLETLTELVEKRGRLVGGARLSEEYLAENTDYSTFEELANALLNGEIKAFSAVCKGKCVDVASCAFFFQIGKTDKLVKMGLQSQYAASMCNEIGQIFCDVTDTLTCGNNAPLFVSILDVTVINVVLQHIPCLKGVLLALDEVCGVKYSLESGNCAEEHQAVRGSFTVNSLFVLMTRYDAVRLTKLNVFV